MRKEAIKLIIAAISCTTCTPPGFPPAAALPSPSRPEIETKVRDSPSKRWIFNFTAEARTYSSNSQTVLNSDHLPDSSNQKETILITARYTVAIDRLQTSVSFSGHVDSLTLEPGFKIGTDKAKIHTPIKFSGTINSNRLTMSTTSQVPTAMTLTENNSCDSPASSLLGEVHSGIILLPAQIQADSRWADTVSTMTCGGRNVPTSVEIVRFYQVTGEQNSGSLTTLLIKRTEHISFRGSGTQGQHQIMLEGQGAGSSDISLDSVTGTVLRIESFQELQLTIRSSGQAKHFIQHVRQHITLTPNQPNGGA